MACVRKYRGSWVVDWRDPSGKRFIETADDKDTAERRLAEVIKSGKAPASKRLTFKEYGEWWLETWPKARSRQARIRITKRCLETTSTPCSAQGRL